MVSHLKLQATNEWPNLLLESEGYSWEFLVGVCRPVLQILTRFQTKKCNFPHPSSDLAFKQELLHHYLD